MRATPIIVFLLCTSAHADCWKIGDLKGVSAKQESQYEISKDGLSDQDFNVQIAGKGSAVIPSSDLQCSQIAKYSMVCLFSEEGRGTVETWSVDPEHRIAYYTKSNSGFGVFDGPVMFVGKIKGSCQ